MGLKMKYFVLKPKSKTRTDPHAVASRIAMVAYAEAIRGHDYELADQLNAWAENEEVLAADVESMNDLEPNYDGNQP